MIGSTRDDVLDVSFVVLWNGVRDQAAELIAIHREEIALALADDVHVGDAVRAQHAIELVEAAERIVALERHIPAK